MCGGEGEDGGTVGPTGSQAQRPGVGSRDRVWGGEGQGERRDENTDPGTRQSQAAVPAPPRLTLHSAELHFPVYKVGKMSASLGRSCGD